MVKALYVYLVRHAESKNNSRDLHDTRSSAALPSPPSSPKVPRASPSREGYLDKKDVEEDTADLSITSDVLLPSPLPGGREPDPGLTGRGKEQARAVAEVLRKIQDDPKTEPRLRPSFVYTSGFQRALETSYPIAESLNLPPQFHQDLHEEGGVFEGPRRGVRRESYPLHFGMNGEQMRQVLPGLQGTENIPQQGWWVGGQEPPADAQKRANRCAEWLWKMAEEQGCDEAFPSESSGAVVCVTHGLFMDRLIKALAGVDPHLGSMLIMTFNCAYWLVQLRIDHDENTPRIAVMAACNVVDHVPMSIRTGHSICGISHCQPSYT